MNIDNALKYTTYVILLCINAFVLLIAYWLLFPYDVQEHYKTPYEVLTPQVKNGEELVYKVDFCKFMNADATIHPAIVDGHIVTLPSKDTSLPRGCYELEAHVELPELAEGEYKYVETIKYRVNPIRTVSYTYESELFEVVE